MKKAILIYVSVVIFGALAKFILERNPISLNELTIFHYLVGIVILMIIAAVLSYKWTKVVDDSDVGAMNNVSFNPTPDFNLKLDSVRVTGKCDRFLYYTVEVKDGEGIKQNAELKTGAT